MQSSIKHQIKKATLINFITRYARIFIQIILSVVLARLLTPNEYGIVAVVTVFIVFFQQLSEAGLGSAVVQHKELTKKELNGLFALTIIMAIVLSLVFFYFSYFIKYFYHDESYLRIGKLMSLVIMFSTISTIPLGLMRRDQKFLEIGIIDIFVSVFSGVVAVFLAYKGASYYALVYRAIIDSIVMFFLYYYSSPLKLGFDLTWSGVKRVFHFSFFQYLTQILTYFGRNADNLIIGKYLGPYALGIYDKAYELMLYPLRNITGLVAGIMHPVMSDYKENKEKVLSVYLKLFHFMTLIGVPISVFFLFTSKEIVLILFGNNWASVIPIFQLFSISIWVQMLISSSGSILQTMGKTNLMFYTSLISNIITVLAMILGLKYGLIGVTISIVLTIFLSFIPVFYIAFNIVLNDSIWSFFKCLKNSIITGIALVIFSLLLKNIILNNLFVSLLVKSFLTTFVVFLFYYFLGEYKFIKNAVFDK